MLLLIRSIVLFQTIGLMKFFIGIVPPAEIYDAVTNIQKRFGDNRLEPHITLRPPIMVVDEANWLKAIENVCLNFSPFQIELPTTGYFGRRVLFITVSSIKLHELYNSLVSSIKPFEQHEKKQDDCDYNPHLTLGRSWCGFTKTNFSEMKELADNYLSQQKASFMATSIRIYHKPYGTGRYAPMKDIPLSVYFKENGT